MATVFIQVTGLDVNDPNSSGPAGGPVFPVLKGTIKVSTPGSEWWSPHADWTTNAISWTASTKEIRQAIVDAAVKVVIYNNMLPEFTHNDRVMLFGGPQEF